MRSKAAESNPYLRYTSPGAEVMLEAEVAEALTVGIPRELYLQAYRIIAEIVAPGKPNPLAPPMPASSPQQGLETDVWRSLPE